MPFVRLGLMNPQFFRATPRAAGRGRGYHIDAILRHSSAQRLQASAHRWQCSASCFAHSAAHASQTSAQIPQMRFIWLEPRLMYAAAAQQIWAQSMHIRAHSGMFSPMHALPQCSHSCAH